ncbi:hypothetical protein NU08_3418 [Flavobacterium anhuiense]|uniref:Uncharacterized protein n=1 Tax=Flavobacterium anhuiense TaxID=459526 RepID=A0A444VW57_9FLAO|nr:hypothetical protein [Flavobacterium anhuiense]RYJ37644.1 hypothetical protein NU08_3418 [Flavobacterium anhuiense]
MQKERVLVHDNNGVFLKMFKRKFKEEFEFLETSFADKNDEIINQCDRIIYVLYNREELLRFLQEDKRTNILVCLFNKQLHKSLSFLDVNNNLILFDESKTSREIFKEVKLFLTKKFDYRNEKKTVSQYNLSKTRFYEYYKAMYFLM